MDSGKARVDAAMGEVLVTAEKLAWTIKHGEKVLKADSRGNSFLMLYKKNEVSGCRLRSCRPLSAHGYRRSSMSR